MQKIKSGTASPEKTSMVSQRDLVWIHFPFSDGTDQKFRPALILSNDKYNSKHPDAIVCAITSNLKNSEYGVQLDGANLEQGKLAIRCMARADKIAQIHQSLIAKAFARLNSSTFDKLVKSLGELTRRQN